jgi:hypothetical protein
VWLHQQQRDRVWLHQQQHDRVWLHRQQHDHACGHLPEKKKSLKLRTDTLFQIVLTLSHRAKDTTGEENAKEN